MINEEFKYNKGKYMISKIAKQITRMIGSCVRSKEDEGKPYTKEEIINLTKPYINILMKKYPATNEKLIDSCFDYFFKENSKKLNFLIERKKSNKITINESQLRQIVMETVKRILKENIRQEKQKNDRIRKRTIG